MSWLRVALCSLVLAGGCTLDEDTIDDCNGSCSIVIDQGAGEDRLDSEILADTTADDVQVLDAAPGDISSWCKTGTITTFADGDFASGWTDEVVVGRSMGSNNSYSTSQQTTGGNPGAFRQITLTIGTGQVALWVLNMRKTATWDPATQGAICGIEAQMDGTDKDAGTSETIYSMAIKQDGKLYWSERFRVNEENWKTMTPAVKEGAFFQWDPVGVAKPDLSATGKPLQFGFLAGAAGNNTTGAPRTFKYGVDNWRFAVCPCS